jgi:hypothetical protein
MRFGTFLTFVFLAIVFKNVHSGGEQSPEEIENTVNFFGEQVAGYYLVAKKIEAETKQEYAARAVQVKSCLSSIKNVTGPKVDDLKSSLNDLDNVFSNPPSLPSINYDAEVSLGRTKRQISFVCIIINEQFKNISATLSAIRVFNIALKSDLVRIEKDLNNTSSFSSISENLLSLLGSQLLAEVSSSVSLTVRKISPQAAYLDKIDLITSDLLGIITNLYTKWCFGSPYETNISECTLVGDISPTKPYCFVQKAFTWVEAYDFCYNRGMNLFRITSLAEQHELSKVAKTVASSSAKLWINGQSLAKKFYAFMPYPTVVLSNIEWVNIAEPESGCMQIVGDTDGTGSFSADSGICTYRYWSFCEYKKPAEVGK